MTDKEFTNCIEQMKRGDMDGLKQIYEAYLAMIYHCMLNQVHNKEMAEDLTSDFFVKLWNIRDSYKGPFHKKWLATIARNMAIDYIRKHGREDLQEDMEPVMPKEPESDAYEQVINRETVKDAMSCLSLEEKEVVDLKVMGELTFKEIGEVLGVPQGTVAWRYREGLNKMRRFLR